MEGNYYFMPDFIRVDSIQLFDKKPAKNDDPMKTPKLDGVTV